MKAFKHGRACEIVAVPEMISMLAVPCPAGFISLEDTKTLSRQARNETVNTHKGCHIGNRFARLQFMYISSSTALSWQSVVKSCTSSMAIDVHTDVLLSQ